MNPRTKRSLVGFTLAFLLCPGLLLHAQVSSTLRVVSVERIAGNQLRLLFHETGTNALDYRLTHQTNLVPGTTNQIDLGARIVDLGDGYYHTLIPQPPDSPRFYRITGFTGPDTDGDGLSDVLEGLVGTNPATFDSDGDGYGDGVELVRRGDPLNPDVLPVIITAAFAATSSSVREGDGHASLAVTLNTNYQGALLYRIADMSTAVAGEDFAPVTGSISINGSLAYIPITILDDTNIEPAKMLAVDLVEDPWSDYQVGGASRHLVQLYDNDAHWSGVMGTTNSSQLGFRLRMLRVGDQVEAAALVSEISTNGTQGVGTIPVGVWPVNATLTTNSFMATAGPIPMRTSLLTGDLELQRLLTFTAAAGNTNHVVRSNLIMGEFTDTLQPVDPGMGWISGGMSGLFVLMEDLPVPAPRQLPQPTGLGNAGVAQAQGGGQ